MFTRDEYQIEIQKIAARLIPSLNFDPVEGLDEEEVLNLIGEELNEHNWISWPDYNYLVLRYSNNPNSALHKSPFGIARVQHWEDLLRGMALWAMQDDIWDRIVKTT